MVDIIGGPSPKHRLLILAERVHQIFLDIQPLSERCLVHFLIPKVNETIILLKTLTIQEFLSEYFGLC